MTRFFTQVNNDMDLFKLGIVYYATMRGIPQFFYGTEILMDSNENPKSHGLIRSDFPGGWPDDNVNAFTGKGLSHDQLQTLNFFKKLLNWRKYNEVIHHGKLIQYAPKPGGKEEIYSYFRTYEDKKVWVIFNRIGSDQTLDLSRYSQVINGFDQGYEVLQDKMIELDDQLEIKAKSVMIIELNP